MAGVKTCGPNLDSSRRLKKIAVVSLLHCNSRAVALPGRWLCSAAASPPAVLQNVWFCFRRTVGEQNALSPGEVTAVWFVSAFDWRETRSRAVPIAMLNASFPPHYFRHVLFGAPAWECCLSTQSWKDISKIIKEHCVVSSRRSLGENDIFVFFFFFLTKKGSIVALGENESDYFVNETDISPGVIWQESLCMRIVWQ